MNDSSAIRNYPRVTFGMIVLNGMPFLPYNLRALYPYAHQIIVVEGASHHASHMATPDGHSTDGTLEELHRFRAEEDPAGKLQTVTRAGFWKDKDQQSQAYAERATGDYLWQVDVDEFYLPETMRLVAELLASEPPVSQVSFLGLHFWGSIDVLVDGPHVRRVGSIHRVFGWGPGYRYITHRTPTVVDSRGCDLRTKNWVRGEDTARHGAYMLHYPLLFPSQVKDKVAYYAKIGFLGEHGPRDSGRYFQNYLSLRNPFAVHNATAVTRLSWLRRYSGRIPEQIRQMWRDIAEGRMAAELRCQDDVSRLLDSKWYQTTTALCQFLMDWVDPIWWPVQSRYLRFRRWAGKVRRRLIRVARPRGLG